MCVSACVCVNGLVNAVSSFTELKSLKHCMEYYVWLLYQEKKKIKMQVYELKLPERKKK